MNLFIYLFYSKSIGAGDSKDQAPFFFKVLMMTAMKKIFTDKNNQEKVVAESGLEYCIVRPGGLNVESPTGVVNVIDGEAGSIPRADVARFCLDAVTVEDFPYIGKAPCISSTGGKILKQKNIFSLSVIHTCI